MRKVQTPFVITVAGKHSSIILKATIFLVYIGLIDGRHNEYWALQNDAV
jgi:hypothetical protein